MSENNPHLGSTFESFIDEDNMPNRTLCDTLEAIRKCYETRNFSYLPGLVEEAQNMANRMESALYDQSDLRYAQKKLKEVKEERRKLEKEIEELEKKKDGSD